MYNLGLYFLNLDLTKTKVFLNLGLKSFVIRAKERTQNLTACFVLYERSGDCDWSINIILNPDKFIEKMVKLKVISITTLQVYYMSTKTKFNLF